MIHLISCSVPSMALILLVQAVRTVQWEGRKYLFSLYPIKLRFINFMVGVDKL